MKKFIFPIVVVLAVACTAGLYYLLFDQQTSNLFYLNTAVACIAEILLLMNIPIWSSKKLLTITNATVSTFTNIYAIAVFLWTLIFSLAIYEPQNEQFKTFLIGLLIVTLLYIVICGIAAVSTTTAEGISEEQTAQVEKRENLKQTVALTIMDICNTLESDESEWKDNTVRLLKMISDKVSSLPSEKLARTPDIAQNVKENIMEISLLCEQIASAEDASTVQTEITNKLNRLNKYITTVKTL